MRYRNDAGQWEVIEPGKDMFVADHEAVVANPHLFRLTFNACHPKGREALRLERQLAAIEGAMKTAPSTTKPATATPTPTPLFGPTGRRGHHIPRSPRPTRHASWRI
jgi:hypothetical protein